jgi:hypothetical protein
MTDTPHEIRAALKGAGQYEYPPRPIPRPKLNKFGPTVTAYFDQKEELAWLFHVWLTTDSAMVEFRSWIARGAPT